MLALTVCGCSVMLSEPAITVKRTALVGLDTAGADLEFHLSISNPNPFDLTLLGYTYNLQVMTLPLTGGGGQQPLAIPSGRETDMRLPVRVQFGDLLEIIKNRPDPDKIPYQLNARLQLKTPLGDMLVPVDRNGVFSVPDQYRPGYYLNRIRTFLPAAR